MPRQMKIDLIAMTSLEHSICLKVQSLKDRQRHTERGGVREGDRERDFENTKTILT